MLRRALGRTGATVSAIGLGCMGMSEFYGPGNDQQSLETLATALEQGIDFLGPHRYSWVHNRSGE
jgi:aryl-alcohol dehydrogenase-like predicted oxidoreductase